MRQTSSPFPRWEWCPSCEGQTHYYSWCRILRTGSHFYLQLMFPERAKTKQIYMNKYYSKSRDMQSTRSLSNLIIHSKHTTTPLFVLLFEIGNPLMLWACSRSVFVIFWFGQQFLFLFFSKKCLFQGYDLRRTQFWQAVKDSRWQNMHPQWPFLQLVRCHHIIGFSLTDHWRMTEQLRELAAAARNS